MRRGWFQSQLSRSVQLYVELTETNSSDGMPLIEPKLLAFLDTRGKEITAYVYRPEPIQLQLGMVTTPLQAKQILENAVNS